MAAGTQREEKTLPHSDYGEYRPPASVCVQVRFSKMTKESYHKKPGSGGVQVAVLK